MNDALKKVLKYNQDYRAGKDAEQTQRYSDSNPYHEEVTRLDKQDVKRQEQDDAEAKLLQAGARAERRYCCLVGRLFSVDESMVERCVPIAWRKVRSISDADVLLVADGVCFASMCHHSILAAMALGLRVAIVQFWKDKMIAKADNCFVDSEVCIATKVGIHITPEFKRKHSTLAEIVQLTVLICFVLLQLGSLVIFCFRSSRGMGGDML